MNTEKFITDSLKAEFGDMPYTLRQKRVTISLPVGGNPTVYDFGYDNHDRFYLMMDTPNAMRVYSTNVLQVSLESDKAYANLKHSNPLDYELFISESIGEYFDGKTTITITPSNPALSAEVVFTFLQFIPCYPSCNNSNT